MKETKSKSSDNSDWYEKWHKSSNHSVTHWIIFAAAIIGCFVLLTGQIANWVDSLNLGQSGIMVKISQNAAQLALSPKTQTVRVGDTFTSDIILDTGGHPVDGVDVYAIHYDPTILRVIDDVSTKKGTQILPGQIMSLTGANIVDEKSGTIKFGAAADGGTSFTGRGILATIHFKAISAGSAFLKFDFTLGSTVDSNVAFRGKDRLSSVVDAIYNVTSK